jgi:uncharacterized membrane protein YhiD involved in acid resistance
VIDLVGFERNLRNASAGDRTFSLIGVGFIGAGVVFRSSSRPGSQGFEVRGRRAVRGR